MNKYSLKNRIVFITGASSGIGAACARAFADEGAKLILAARRMNKLKEVAASLNVPTHLIELDVRDRTAVEQAVAQLPAEWQAIAVLLNNAGLARENKKFHEYSVEDMDEMMDTNVKGLIYVTRSVLPGMVARNQPAHIINIGSLAGHVTYPGGAAYCGSKAAVKSISEGLKLDLLGTPIRVTSVDPGLVETEFSVVRFHGDRERANKVYENLKPLNGDDVADTILFAATRPPHINLNDIIMMPVAQSGVGPWSHRGSLSGIN
jgi:serine 3-dehydrogenase